MDYFPDNGAFSGDKIKAEVFLYNNNFCAFVIFIIAIIVSQFWFEFFHQIVREITGQDEPDSYYMLLVAIFWTSLFMLIVYFFLKVPIAASYTF